MSLSRRLFGKLAMASPAIASTGVSSMQAMEVPQPAAVPYQYSDGLLGYMEKAGRIESDPFMMLYDRIPMHKVFQLGIKLGIITRDDVTRCIQESHEIHLSNSHEFYLASCKSFSESTKARLNREHMLSRLVDDTLNPRNRDAPDKWSLARNIAKELFKRGMLHTLADSEDGPASDTPRTASINRATHPAWKGNTT